MCSDLSLGKRILRSEIERNKSVYWLDWGIYVLYFSMNSFHFLSLSFTHDTTIRCAPFLAFFFLHLLSVDFEELWCICVCTASVKPTRTCSNLFILYTRNIKYKEEKIIIQRALSFFIVIPQKYIFEAISKSVSWKKSETFSLFLFYIEK